MAFGSLEDSKAGGDCLIDCGVILATYWNIGGIDGIDNSINN